RDDGQRQRRNQGRRRGAGPVSPHSSLLLADPDGSGDYPARAPRWHLAPAAAARRTRVRSLVTVLQTHLRQDMPQPRVAPPCLGVPVRLLYADLGWQLGQRVPDKPSLVRVPLGNEE